MDRDPLSIGGSPPGNLPREEPRREKVSARGLPASQVPICGPSSIASAAACLSSPCLSISASVSSLVRSSAGLPPTVRRTGAGRAAFRGSAAAPARLPKSHTRRCPDQETGVSEPASAFHTPCFTVETQRMCFATGYQSCTASSRHPRSSKLGHAVERSSFHGQVSISKLSRFPLRSHG